MVEKRQFALGDTVVCFDFCFVYNFLHVFVYFLKNKTNGPFLMYCLIKSIEMFLFNFFCCSCKNNQFFACCFCLCFYVCPPVFHSCVCLHLLWIISCLFTFVLSTTSTNNLLSHGCYKEKDDFTEK